MLQDEATMNIALPDQIYPGANALFESPGRKDGSRCAVVGGLPPLRIRRPPCREM